MQEGVLCSSAVRMGSCLPLQQQCLSAVTLPLFLFSATFYPLDVYPPALQTITRISPLYHGVELIRGFMLGVADVTMLGHAAFLAVMGLIGLAITSRRLEKLLLT